MEVFERGEEISYYTAKRFVFGKGLRVFLTF